MKTFQTKNFMLLKFAQNDKFDSQINLMFKFRDRFETLR